MVEEYLKEKLRIRNKLCREVLAEFLGTFILISFGDGSVAQFVLGRGEYGSFLTVNWAWGLAVAMGVWVSGGVSGKLFSSFLTVNWAWGLAVAMGVWVSGAVSSGHINPAVSLVMAILGRLPWIKFPFYMVAQYLGAIVASACVYGVYYDALEEFDGGNRTVGGSLDTAGIWATYPQDYLSTASGFGDQIFGTALLMLCILAITDKHNMPAPTGVAPFCIGLTVVVIGMSFGVNCGYAINPARDLGPRIFTSMAGWGVEPFSYRDYNWFWVPIVGPHIGAICGAFIYLLMVGIHFPGDDDDGDEGYDINAKHGDVELSGVANSGFVNSEKDLPRY